MISTIEQRLATLERYDVLDTFPESRFERLTRLAANIFGTPMALISLIDRDRQWFKSHRGVAVCETPLNVSFCKHAIEAEGVFVVLDAARDPRFCENSLVTGGLNIRFYAGAPLQTGDGLQVGTLCILDTLPRTRFNAAEKQILADLAALVVDQFELRLAFARRAEERPE